MKYSQRRAISAVALVAMVFGLNFGYIGVAHAASISAARDTMSSLTDSANASHTIEFITPSGVGSGQSFSYTFPTGFTLLAEDANNFDLAVSAGASCASFTDKTVALTAATSTWGIDVTGQVITVTSGTDTITAGRCIQLEAGTAATNGATGAANTIVNQTVGQNNSDSTIEISVNAGTDTGSIAVEIITDDSVNVTASVDPSITFSISDVAIGFGTLTTGAVRYANGAATGSATVTPAHTLTAGTNAASGLSVTYNGALLTSAGNNIDAATISGDADGTAGTEQFAISFDDNGSTFTMVSAYDENSNNSSFVASTTTQIFSSGGPVASTAVDAHYLANINANTPAGNYSTDLTYIATGTF